MPEEVLEHYSTGARLHGNMTKSVVSLTQPSRVIFFFFPFPMLLISRAIQVFNGTSPILPKQTTTVLFQPILSGRKDFICYWTYWHRFGLAVKKTKLCMISSVSNTQKRPRIRLLRHSKTIRKMKAFPGGHVIIRQCYLPSWEGLAEFPAPTSLHEELWGSWPLFIPSHVVCDQGLWTSWEDRQI